MFKDGEYKLIDAENEQVYAYLRCGEKETLLVVCNFTEETIVYPVMEYANGKKTKLMISNYEDAPKTLSGELELKPYGAYVYIL